MAMTHKPTPPMNEHFAIELDISNTHNCYYIDGRQIAHSIEHATKFQSINTAIQFNRIIEGRIVSIIS